MRLKLTAPLRSRDGTLAKGAGMKNALAELHGDKVKLIKRPGLALGSETVTGGTPQGMIELNGVAYSVVQDSIWRLEPGASSPIPGGSFGATGAWNLAGSAYSGNWSEGGSYAIGDSVAFWNPPAERWDAYFANAFKPPVSPVFDNTGGYIGNVPQLKGSWFWSPNPPGTARFRASRGAYTSPFCASAEAAGSLAVSNGGCGLGTSAPSCLGDARVGMYSVGTFSSGAIGATANIIGFIAYVSGGSEGQIVGGQILGTVVRTAL